MRGAKINMISAKTLEPNPKEISFVEGFEKFIAYCRIKNLREKTVKNYRENYSRFIAYVENCTLLKYIGELKQSHIDDYVFYLCNTKMKPSSVNTYLRGLRVIINFYIKNRYCEAVIIHMIKTDKSSKETYSDIELFKLLAKPNLTTCDFTEYRNWVIINFFIATGVRASTLIHIKIKDLDFQFDRITLEYTKTRQSYIIPMSYKIKTILLEYVKFRKGDDEDYLFCTQYGTQMLLDGLKHAISKYNRRRGVTKTGLHLFRHTFAKRTVMNGMNVFVLQKWLGHSDISVTQEYVNLYTDDLAQNIQNINPLDTLIPFSASKKNKKKLVINELKEKQGV